MMIFTSSMTKQISISSDTSRDHEPIGLYITNEYSTTCFLPSQVKLWEHAMGQVGCLLFRSFFGAPIFVNCNDLNLCSGCIYRISKLIASDR